MLTALLVTGIVLVVVVLLLIVTIAACAAYFWTSVLPALRDFNQKAESASDPLKTLPQLAEGQLRAVAFLVQSVEGLRLAIREFREQLLAASPKRRVSETFQGPEAEGRVAEEEAESEAVLGVQELIRKIPGTIRDHV